MTRKDYQLIADAIRTADISYDDTDTVAHALAWALRETNPRFDAARFLDACGCEYHADWVKA